MFLFTSVYLVVMSFFFFFKQKTAYEMRISDWSSDVCSSDLLAIDPASTVVALRSYRQAIESGDSALALRAAHLLDQNVALPPDGPLLLMSEALQKKDWKKARALSLRLSKEHKFAFLSPIIDGWISLGERKYAPPVLPEDGAIAPLTRRYLSQDQALQYLALDDVENALPFIQDALTLRTDLLPGFRMVAAARLAALDRKDLALALLKIRNKDAARLSRNIEAVRKPRPQVRPAAQGYARLLFQLAERSEERRVGKE